MNLEKLPCIYWNVLAQNMDLVTLTKTDFVNCSTLSLFEKSGAEFIIDRGMNLIQFHRNKRKIILFLFGQLFDVRTFWLLLHLKEQLIVDAAARSFIVINYECLVK